MANTTLHLNFSGIFPEIISRVGSQGFIHPTLFAFLTLVFR